MGFSTSTLVILYLSVIHYSQIDGMIVNTDRNILRDFKNTQNLQDRETDTTNLLPSYIGRGLQRGKRQDDIFLEKIAPHSSSDPEALRESSLIGDFNSNAEYKLTESILQVLSNIIKSNKERIYFLPRILTTSSRILEAIIDFKDQWLQETWEDTTWEELDSIFPEENDCQSVIEILPCIQPFTKSSLVQISRHSLSLLMSYTVALEFIFLDEVLHENRLHLIRNFDLLLKEIKALALSLIELLEANDEAPDKHLISALTSRTYEANLHSVTRKIRATAFLRQFEKGTRYIMELISGYESSKGDDYTLDDNFV